MPGNSKDTIRFAAGALPLAISLIAGGVSAAPSTMYAKTQAKTYAKTYTGTVIYSFDNAHGQTPYGGATLAADGNIYGTTYAGGANNLGTIYKVTPGGTLTTLYSFSGPVDGAGPQSTPIVRGNTLWGTASNGGANGVGTVFSFNLKTGKFKVLATFDRTNGGFPIGGLARDAAGNLYGTTQKWGANFAGEIYKLSKDGTVTILYSFQPNTDGEQPSTDLAIDKAGNLYGATQQGNGSTGGAVFKYSVSGTFSVLHLFSGDQGNPNTPAGPLALDSSGDVYGAFNFGGTDCDGSGNGCGGLYEIAANGTYTTLQQFNGTNGAYPLGGVTLQGQTLYGATAGTSYTTNSGGGASVFSLAVKKNKLTVDFTFPTAAGAPKQPNHGAVMHDKLGNIYGVSIYGGANNEGAIFQVGPAAQ